MESSLYHSSSVKGQVALITGASAGIGLATAWRLAEAGCKLVLVARRTDKLTALADDIQQHFPDTRCEVVSLDVQDLSAIAAMPDTLPEDVRCVDILVNNAGLVLGVDTVDEVVMPDMEVMIATNITAVIAFTRAFTPGMLARGRGHVVNISSVAGHEAYGRGGVYCATKHAVDAFTTTTRHDLVATPVRVTAISPGAVHTDFSLVRYRGDKEAADAVYRGFTPLSGPDIADNIMYAVTRPAHVQIADMLVYCTAQSSAKGLARAS